MVAHDIADASFLLAVMVLRMTFRGGSFDRSGVGLELYAEWKRRRGVGLSSTGRTRAASGTRTHQPSILESIQVTRLVQGTAALAKRSQQRPLQWY